MTDNVDYLILDLLDWLRPGSRPYGEVLDAWRASCPRLPVWEEATERGFIDRKLVIGRGQFISVSAAGADYRCQHGR
jgi:D-3-phosphoglycerate dehydrogenase